MHNRIGRLIILAGLFMPRLAFAVDPNAQKVIDSACQASADPANCAGAHPLFGTGGLLTGIVNILIFVIGAISVVMIIIGGMRYALSGGDSAGLKSAKDTILYALVGLVIAVLSFTIVQFVIGRIG